MWPLNSSTRSCTSLSAILSFMKKIWSIWWDIKTSAWNQLCMKSDTCMCCFSAWPQHGGSRTAYKSHHYCKRWASLRSGHFPTQSLCLWKEHRRVWGGSRWEEPGTRSTVRKLEVGRYGNVTWGRMGGHCHGSRKPLIWHVYDNTENFSFIVTGLYPRW